MTAFVSRFELGAAGPTLGIKDCIDIAGMQTRSGSRALEDSPPAKRHADVVQRVLDAGWRITGKATMHELAYGMSGVNAWAGTPLNPQAPDRIPGGSSSGSAAAVGSGEVDAALGSDTGGSIRLPAACCGVIGMKPSFSRVSRRGAWPRASTLDCIGPFARDMETLIRLMDALAPDFDTDRADRYAGNSRVAIVATDSEAPIEAALQSALAATGWRTERSTLAGMRAAFEAGMAIINVETWQAFGHLLPTGRVGPDVAARLEQAGTTKRGAVDLAEAIRASFTAAVDAALADVDALVLPTLPTLPPRLDEVKAGLSILGLSAHVRPFNLSGHPALSIPIPVAGSAIKAGLQLVGRRGDDERLCALGLHLEQALAASHS